MKGMVFKREVEGWLNSDLDLQERLHKNVKVFVACVFVTPQGRYPE